MSFGDFWINNNGKKEHLNNAKHGVRKDQLDEKFHNLFDAYDVNGDGTLENEELGGIFKGLTKFAGADKTLDAAENKKVASLFANQAGIKDADFMGFVRSVSKATENIIESKTTPTPDGGREVTTTYKDGSVETISYYPDGEYKFKKLDKKGTLKGYNITINDQEKFYTPEQMETQIKAHYDQYMSAFQTDAGSQNISDKKKLTYDEFKKNILNSPNTQKMYDGEMHALRFSERAQEDIQVRDFILNYYIETHREVQEALESMGIFDDAGALINDGAGEIWNAIKNKWNGTEEEFQSFYNLSKLFEPSYNRALVMNGDLERMRLQPEIYFRDFETDMMDLGGTPYNYDKSVKFQQTIDSYQNAQILQQKIDVLDKAMLHIKMYQNEQYLITNSPAQSEGLNPAGHIMDANKLLLQYFDGDQDAVDMVLDGTVGNAEETIKVISGLKENVGKLYDTILDGKTFEELENDYKSQYKEMYGTSFVPDELTEKVMEAKATGGMVKLAAITVASILITKTPIMAEISAAAAGSTEATGAAANLVRTLVAKYGQTAVQQGLKLAMTNVTLATDVGLTVINQATSERGVNGGELWESTKGSAKYIFFGAYVGAPLAQGVSKALGKIGATSRLFEGGVKTGEGAIQTTSITGDKLLQNFMKGGNTVLAKGGAFLTEVGAFAGLDVASGDMDIAEAIGEQGTFLPKLKLMNHVLEYMLGARAHTATSRADLNAAIKKSGVDKWNIKEIKTPKRTEYIVDIDGLPVGKFEDANQLATAMLERVTANYTETELPASVSKPKPETKPTPQGMNADENRIVQDANSVVKPAQIHNENYINEKLFENQMSEIGLEKRHVNVLLQNIKDADGNIPQDVVDILKQDPVRFKKFMHMRSDILINRIKSLKNSDGYYMKDAIDLVKKGIAEGKTFDVSLSAVADLKNKLGEINENSVGIYENILEKFSDIKDEMFEITRHTPAKNQQSVLGRLYELKNDENFTDIVKMLSAFDKNKSVSVDMIEKAKKVVENTDKYTRWKLEDFVKSSKTEPDFNDSMVASELIKNGIENSKDIEFCLAYLKLNKITSISDINFAELKNLKQTGIIRTQNNDFALKFYQKCIDNNISKEKYFELITKYKDHYDYLKFDEVQDLIIKNPDKEYTISKVNNSNNFFQITEKNGDSGSNETIRYQYMVEKDGSLTYLCKETESRKKFNTCVTTEYPDGTVKKGYYDGILDFLQLANFTLEETISPEGKRVSRTLSKPSKTEPGVVVTLQEIYDNAGNVTEVRELGKMTHHGSQNQGLKIQREYTSPSGIKSTHKIIQGPKGTFSEFESAGFGITRKFQKINKNNVTETEVNGEKYSAKFDENKIEIKRITRNGETEIIVLDSDLLDFSLMDLYKQLPGDYLFRLKKLGIKVKRGYEHNNACFDGNNRTIQISDGRANDPFVFAHEFGHALDFTILNKLSVSDELRSIYTRELNKMYKENTSAMREIIGYFTDANGGLGEIIAEVNAISSGLLSPENNHLQRAKILQENFPETTAYILNKIKNIDENAEIQEIEWRNAAERRHSGM